MQKIRRSHDQRLTADAPGCPFSEVRLRVLDDGVGPSQTFHWVRLDAYRRSETRQVSRHAGRSEADGHSACDRGERNQAAHRAATQAKLLTVDPRVAGVVRDRSEPRDELGKFRVSFAERS